MSEIVLRPVGWVRGGRVEAEDDGWDSETATIELDTTWLSEAALLGLTDFSHAEVVYHFDRLPESEIVLTARHPRGNPDWPRVGVFPSAGATGPTGSRLVCAGLSRSKVRG